MRLKETMNSRIVGMHCFFYVYIMLFAPQRELQGRCVVSHETIGKLTRVSWLKLPGHKI